MKSTVQAIALFTSAVSSALGQALVALSEDPLLEYNYGIVAILAMAGAVGFWFTFHKTDKQEDRMNALKVSEYMGRKAGDEENKAVTHSSVQEEKNEKSGLN